MQVSHKGPMTFRLGGHLLVYCSAIAFSFDDPVHQPAEVSSPPTEENGSQSAAAGLLPERISPGSARRRESFNGRYSLTKGPLISFVDVELDPYRDRCIAGEQTPEPTTSSLLRLLAGRKWASPMASAARAVPSQ